MASVWIERRRTKAGSTRYRVDVQGRRTRGAAPLRWLVPDDARGATPSRLGRGRARRAPRPRSRCTRRSRQRRRPSATRRAVAGEPGRRARVAQGSSTEPRSTGCCRSSATVRRLDHAGRRRGALSPSSTAGEGARVHSEERHGARDGARLRRHRPNPARDRVQVRLPLEEPDEPEPPSAEHGRGRRLAPDARLPRRPARARRDRLPGRRARGRPRRRPRRGTERLARARGRLKDAAARWVELPDDLFAAISSDCQHTRTATRRPALSRRDRRPPPHGDRPRLPRCRRPEVRAARSPAPADLLLHRQGESWAEIGERVGQRSKLVTADRYTHALIDYREIDRAKLLERVATVPPRCPPRASENRRLAGTF